MSQTSTLQNTIFGLIRGTTWGSRIAIILVALIIWVWSEGAIVEDIETPSSIDRGNVGNVVKYTCSAHLQDYFKKQASSSIKCEQAPKTIWVGHFPGSGVEVVRKIVKAITGMNAPSTFFDDGHVLPSPDTNCQDWSPIHVTDCPLSVDCPLPKYNPHRNPNGASNDPQIRYHKASVLVLRNPLTAVPSRVNMQYQEGLPKDEQHKDLFSPAPQSPASLWKSKRVKYLQSYLLEWERVIVQWTVAGSVSFYPNVDLVIAQERLISPHYGPHLIQLLTEELVDAGSPIQIVSPNATLSHQEIYYCLWELLVDKDYHDPTTIATKRAQDNAKSKSKTKKVRKKKKNDGSGDDDGDDEYDTADIYQPGYTKDEYNKVSEMVEHVIHEELATDSKNPQQRIHRTELMHILNDYRKDLDDAVSTSYVRIVKK